MSKHYEDWTDWAGDHPEQAEADLRAEREKAEAKAIASIRKGLYAYDAEPGAKPEEFSCATIVGYSVCQHTEVYATGHCADCGDEVEGFEPADAQIPGTYDIRKAAA